MKSLEKHFRSSLLLYNIVLFVYSFILQIAAIFHPKAQKWVKGRKGLLQKIANDFEKLEQSIKDQKRKVIWVHVASLGEFEQGRPIMEALKKQHSNCVLVLTFFSPSGYEIRKNYPIADHVYYLPLDSKKNAEAFIDAIQPDLVVFVKYEFWYYYFQTLKQRNIPIFIISAIFRPEQHFFKWYGSLFRALLEYCEHIFVQNEESLQLLQGIGLEKVSIAGDTRLDRVFENSNAAKAVPIVAAFKGNSTLWVAGSTWSKDEEILAHFFIQKQKQKENHHTHLPSAVHRPPSTVPRLIIAPHEINEKHLLQIEKQLTVKSVRYSDCNETMSFEGEDFQVLIVDNIGLLSSIYQYADYVYIGGGFGAGIHNTMEAAVFGVPIFFGPNYQKFQEAIDLIELGGAYLIEGLEDLTLKAKRLEENEDFYTESSKSSRDYVLKHKGGSELILKVLEGYLG